jgi:hypothetical protein
MCVWRLCVVLENDEDVAGGRQQRLFDGGRDETTEGEARARV